VDALQRCSPHRAVTAGSPAICIHALLRDAVPHLASEWMRETGDRPVALHSIMTGPWPYKPFTFRALQKTYGPMWVRCDLCRRYAHLRLTGLLDVDYRTKRFSCSRCGSEAWVCLVEPVKELGMDDYRLDEIDDPQRHPDAVARLLGPRSQSTINQSGGNCPAARSTADADTR